MKQKVDHKRYIDNFRNSLHKHHFRMVSCLIREWETLAKTYSLSHPITIFFGGGTPSLMEVSNIEELVHRISNGGSVEVSLEANPCDLLAGKIQSLRDAGVTRLSIGVQALNDKDLSFLNRNHNVNQVWTSLEESLRTFPKSTSADLIFGRPGQTVESFCSELGQLTSLGLPHISLYQLTVERGTKLHKQVARGEVKLPDEDIMADMYIAGRETMAGAGLTRYEVSNFSKAGAECDHNMGYWSGRQYLGLGPGAHSRLGYGDKRQALVTIPHPETWMAEVEARGHGVRRTRDIPIIDGLKELLATGLRTEAGVREADWDRACAGRVNMSDLLRKMDQHQQQELGVRCSDGCLRVMPERLCVLDNILPHLFNKLDEIYE